MDNQDSTEQPSSDPSATRTRLGPQTAPSSLSGQPEPTQQEALLSRSLSDEAPYANAPLLPDVEVDILEVVPALPRPRRFRSCVGRVVVMLLTLLLGVAIGLGAIFWYGLSGEGPVTIIPPSARGSLVAEVDKSFLTQLVRNNVASSGLPGQVENVNVDLETGAMIVVTGGDVYSVLGLSVTRHFTVDVQPYVQSCVMQVRITHADLGGLPVTTFVQMFQGNVNQQLARKPVGLPSGFTYCTVGVRTEPGGLFVTYLATPVKQ